jgi:predicted permease
LLTSALKESKILRRHRVPVAVILTLILGVGCVVGVVAIWRKALNPYGVTGGDRFMKLVTENKAKGYAISPDYPIYEAWRKELRSFAELGAFKVQDATLRTSEGSRVMQAALVDEGTIKLLQIRPRTGRLFESRDPDDRQTTMLISRRLARAMFGGAEAAIDEVVTVDGRQQTVVGILPAEYKDVFSSVHQVDLVMALDPKGVRSVRVLGRLKDGISPEEAQAELTGWGSLQSAEISQDGELSWGLQPPLKLIPASTLNFLKVAMGGCVLFLLVTLSNVLHLVAAQLDRERRERAIRWALGQGRWHFVRRKLGQGFLLTVIPGVGATLLAFWGLEILRVTLPESLQFISRARVGWQELVIAWFACTVIIAFLGSLPTVWARSTSLLHDLRTETRFGRPSFLGKVLGHGHILTTLASAAVLVVGAYLVLGSLIGLSRVELGFDPQGVQVVEVELPGWKYESQEQLGAFFKDFAQRLRAEPGLAEAALASSTPPSSGVAFGALRPTVGEAQGEIPPIVGLVEVRPGYFRILHQPVIAGEDFREADLAPDSPAVVLSETLARFLYGGPQAAVGKGLFFEEELLEVRGVVRDVRTEGMFRDLGGIHLYTPLNQFSHSASVVLRTESGVGEAARKVALAMDPDVVVASASMESRVADSLTGIRFFARLFGLLTALTIALAAMGVYGVLNHFARRHQAQVALRMALGATPDSVLRWMLTRGLLLGVVGAALGVALSYPFAKLLEGQLFGLEAGNWVARAVAVVLVLLATMVATWLPARRASRVDPAEFLKES